MHRTQLYLDDDLYNTLRERAKQDGTSVSHLVRQAARNTYMTDLEKRREAMMAIVGLWVDRTDLPDTETYIRNLRRSPNRNKRLGLE